MIEHYPKTVTATLIAIVFVLLFSVLGFIRNDHDRLVSLLEKVCDRVSHNQWERDNCHTGQ